MLQGCTCRERKGDERTDGHRGVCRKGEKIPSWLPNREHRVDASSVEGESDR